MKERLDSISGTIYLLGFLPYIWFVWKTRKMAPGTPGKAEPAKVSWLIWSLIDTIIIAGMFAEKSVNGLIVGALIGVWSTFILVLKYGNPGWSALDKFCLICGASSLLLWKIFSSPLLAILACLFAALVGSIPTFVSAWENPERENKLAWAIFAFGATLGIFVTIQEWTLAKGALSLTFLTIDGTVAALVFLPRKNRNG